MADVYGFNEAKSKIAVVDKATQDAKDASQDTSITGLDERVTALEGYVPKDGTSGQVWTSDGAGAGVWADAPGGNVPVEIYGDGEVSNSVEITFDESITVPVTTSTSRTWYVMGGNSSSVNTGGLYYDVDNNALVRCKWRTNNITHSGTMSTSKSFYSTTTNIEIRDKLYPYIKRALVGKSINHYKTDICEFYLRIGSSVLYVTLIEDDDWKITDVDLGGPYSNSTSVTFSGTVTATIVSTGSTFNQYLLDSESTEVPSNYTKIVAL